MSRHFNDPDGIAQSAVLAMLFELSSSPKPGNVDRCHDFPDIGFHHFLASAVSSYPVFRKAALAGQESGGAQEDLAVQAGQPGRDDMRSGQSPEGDNGLGSLIFQAVTAWQRWNLSSNTHFGSLTLMIPIAVAAARPGELQDELSSVLVQTSVSDSVEFYRAFQLAGARVAEVESFSLNDDGWEAALRDSKKTLLDLMQLSAGHDLVAREWANGYQRTFLLADRIREETEQWGINDGIVRSFLQALSEEPDSLISAKFGMDVARWVSEKAGEALFDPTLEEARELDADLLEQDINPGSTADLIAAALFISLLRGLRF